MDPLPEAARRTLAYVSLVNRGGAHPSQGSVTEFFRDAKPIRLDVMSGFGARMAELMTMRQSERPIEYLLRMEWVDLDAEQGVVLTPTGKALVRGLEAADVEHDPVIEAVLDVDDPFAYAKVVAHLRTDEAAMLVDPWLRQTQLIDLYPVPTIERVLVTSRHKGSDLVDLARGAKVFAEDGRAFELRQTREIHDRYLVPRDGPVRMLGGSLGTIGRAPITLTTLSEELSQMVRERHEQMWKDAAPVTLPEPEGKDDEGARG